MSRKKKVILFLIAMIGLYIGSTAFGLSRDEGAMGEAMSRVRSIVQEARNDIKKEMNKPFILRLFGSLFGMENNTFQKMKEKLPKELSSALPNLVVNFSITTPSTAIACEGMRLVDALLYLQQREVVLEQVSWFFDDTLDSDEGRYIQASGTVLRAEQTPSGGASLVIQLVHSFNDENGLGETETQRLENLATLRQQAEVLRQNPPLFDAWWAYEDEQKKWDLASTGFQVNGWRARRLAFRDLEI